MNETSVRCAREVQWSREVHNDFFFFFEKEQYVLLEYIKDSSYAY